MFIFASIIIKMTTMKILDHQHVFYDGMKEIYKSRKYSDIILIAGGKQYHCHRIILCAFKPEWCNLRTVTPHPKSKFNPLVNYLLDNKKKICIVSWKCVNLI